MRIFVTGASGFIGKYFIGECINRGHEVIAHARHKNKIFTHNNLIWNFDDLFDLNPALLIGVDVVVHFAATGISPRISDEYQLQKINVDLASSLLHKSQSSGVRRFVAAGTYAEYGLAARDYEAIPSNAPLMPITPYAKSKAKSFQLLLDDSLRLGVEFFYLRIFSAFGDGQYHKNLWPALKRAALSGEDFKLTSGAQIRDFISVSDVAKAFGNAATTINFSNKPAILNVGSGIGLSVKEFANSWWKSHGAKGRLVFDAIPQRGDEPDRYIADISIERELGLFEKC